MSEPYRQREGRERSKKMEAKTKVFPTPCVAQDEFTKKLFDMVKEFVERLVAGLMTFFETSSTGYMQDWSAVEQLRATLATLRVTTEEKTTGDQSDESDYDPQGESSGEDSE